LSGTGSAGLLAALSTAASAQQTVGPGNVTQTVTQNSNNTTTTIVGSTSLIPPVGSQAAFVRGGSLVFDPALGPTPGFINSTTANAIGIEVQGSGTLVINPGGTFITTAGANADAIQISAANLRASLSDLSITTNGPAAAGISLLNPSDAVNATRARVNTLGDGASALFTDGNSDFASFMDSALSSASGPTIHVNKGSADIFLTNTSVMGNSEWLHVSGVANVTATRSMLTGAAITDSGSSSTVTLQATSLWNMTGNSNLTNLTNNASTINVAPPTVRKDKQSRRSRLPKARLGGREFESGSLDPLPGIAAIQGPLAKHRSRPRIGHRIWVVDPEMLTPRRRFVRQGLPITSKIAASGRETPSALSYTIIGAQLGY